MNSSKITLNEACSQFLRSLTNLPENEKDRFCNFVNTQVNRHYEKKDNRRMIIDAIQEDLREEMPDVRAQAPDEDIHFPNRGQFKGYDHKNTVHVDSFLYNDEMVDALCAEGLIPQNYCCDCGSTNTKPTHFISHSFSFETLLFIYSERVLDDLSGKTVLDVGSRLGAALYMGHLYSNASKLIGVEYNSFFANLQRKMIEQYKLDDRVEIIEDNIFNHEKLLNESDVVILHNVFEWFMSLEDQQQSWRKIRQHVVRPGQLIVACPSLSDSLEYAGLKDEINLEEWVEEIPLDYPCEHDSCDHNNNNNNDNNNNEEENENDENDNDENENDEPDIFLYKVKK